MHNKESCSPQATGREIVRFVVIVLGLGTLLQLAAIRAGIRQGGGGGVWLLLTMWAPALAALAASRTSRQVAWRALKRPGWRWLAPGLLIGFAPPMIKAALLALSGGGSWDSAHFELAADGASIKAIHKLGVLLGAGEQGFGLFALNLFLSASLGSVVTGLIWAYWHLPANLMGYNDDKHPLLNALLLFPLAVVAMSFGFAWLTRRSGSTWPAALAHGANNTLSSAFLMTPKDWSADVTTELLSMALVSVVFVWMSLQRGRKQQPELPVAPVAVSA